jgi:hypothetical protein
MSWLAQDQKVTVIQVTILYLEKESSRKLCVCLRLAHQANNIISPPEGDIFVYNNKPPLNGESQGFISG